MDNRIYQIALSALPGIGPANSKLLLETIGDLEGVFKESTKNLEKIEGFKPGLLSNINRDKTLIRAEQELEFIEQNQVQLYYFEDVNFPKILNNCEDAPIVLYALGKVNFNQKNISIVGTRKSTSYGKKMCEELVKDLASNEVQIISGLAHGIDKVAHEAAIRNNLPTIGVLGHGLDSMYPAAHRPLAKRMLENGGLVTEFMSGVPGDPGNFPKRNRIVAGLSLATVVVESSESGGSMITANLAFDYNREVFAFPGNVDRNTSSGCNNLIKRSKAHIITSAEDMMKILDWELIEKEAESHQELFDDLTETERVVFDLFLEHKSLNADDLAISTGMTSADLSVHLFNLEMKGAINSLPGKRYALA